MAKTNSILTAYVEGSSEKYFFKSDAVKVFPCARRGQKTSTDTKDQTIITSFDLEAKLNTEANMIKAGSNMGGLIPSYVASWIDDSLVCVLGGYTFSIKVNQEEIKSLSGNNNVWFKIKKTARTIYATTSVGTTAETLILDRLYTTQQVQSEDLDDLISANQDHINADWGFLGLEIIFSNSEVQVDPGEYILEVFNTDGKIPPTSLLPNIKAGSTNHSSLIENLQSTTISNTNSTTTKSLEVGDGGTTLNSLLTTKKGITNSGNIISQGDTSLTGKLTNTGEVKIIGTTQVTELLTTDKGITNTGGDITNIQNKLSTKTLQVNDVSTLKGKVTTNAGIENTASGITSTGNTTLTGAFKNIGTTEITGATTIKDKLTTKASIDNTGTISSSGSISTEAELSVGTTSTLTGAVTTQAGISNTGGNISNAGNYTTTTGNITTEEGTVSAWNLQITNTANIGKLLTTHYGIWNEKGITNVSGDISNAGNYTTTKGNITTAEGAITATAGNITATNGNIVATNGNISATKGKVSSKTLKVSSTSETTGITNTGTFVTGDAEVKAVGTDSFAAGARTTQAYGKYSAAFNQSKAGHEGDGWVENGKYSFAANHSNSTGDYSFTCGGGLSVSDYPRTESGATGAFACGQNAVASGKGSFAHGQLASGQSSNAAGLLSAAFNNSYAKGETSFAVNKGHATGKNTFAAGVGTEATAENQFVVGTFNETNPSALFIVGNGSGSTAKSNVLVAEVGQVSIKKPLDVHTDVRIHARAGSDLNDGGHIIFEKQAGASTLSDVTIGNYAGGLRAYLYNTDNGGSGYTCLSFNKDASLSISANGIQHKVIKIIKSNNNSVEISATNADFTNSVTIGQGVNTGTNNLSVGSGTTEGDNCMSCGENNMIGGRNAIGVGTANYASYNNSATFGSHLKTGMLNQTVVGKYNALDSNALFVVGCGWGDSYRYNALTVGGPNNADDVFIRGNLYVKDNLVGSIKVTDNGDGTWNFAI